MKRYSILTGMSLLAFVLIIAGAAGIRYLNRSDEQKAEQKLESLLSQIEVKTVTPRKAAVDLTDLSIAASLPEISEYPLSVTGAGDVNIEIFASPEKAGTGSDGWLTDAAQAFNAEHYPKMSVSIRCMTSGMGADYITSGAYLPDAYTPSSEMWGKLAVADGAELTLCTERLVPNTAGILIPENFPEMSFKEILEASVSGQISMGYTYPYTSSTGLNFLISALYAFDAENPLSGQAVEAFQKFQASVPFVCYTTQQMRTAMNSGALNACVTEYQIYLNDTAWQKHYQFIPFGTAHDNPLYEVGNIGNEKRSVLHTFAEYCLSPEQQKKASQYGFQEFQHQSSFPDADAGTLRSAQALWKKEKDAGRPAAAVFIADCSGSMNGKPLNRLKASLLQASNYINEKHYIGLVSYHSEVMLNLPIAEFDLNHRAEFTGAVQDLSASGATCTYDAVLQGMHMLLEFRKSVPDSRLMLFVLSDGETNAGHSFSDVKELLTALDIPVYTISYNANLSELENLSALNEAACIHADSQDVIYQLSALFNAQM